ncbi:MAG: glutathione S-transferase family protein [Limnohabitans sp.]|nr:glutathione S-transferase family protein [Limnohabitans sp.]
MAELILHHFAQSPFAEKIRLMLGFKQLAWKEVHLPLVMPKPKLLALTGGYRKTPVLQIGADLYCDTALIAQIINDIQPEPNLYPLSCDALTRMLSQWADTLLFPTFSGFNLQPRGAEYFFNAMKPEQAQALIADRMAMRGGQERIAYEDAHGLVIAYLNRRNQILKDNHFICGDQPSLADFSCYHPMWFTHSQVSILSSIFNDYPFVQSWFERMQSFGHGSSTVITADEAIAIDKKVTPKTLPTEKYVDLHAIELGSEVKIRAQSFGTESTRGKLIAANHHRSTLESNSPKVGLVHVHFPRLDFVLKKI